METEVKREPLKKNMHIETRAVHAGDRKGAPVATPVTTPIYQTASFFYDEIETVDRIFGNEVNGFAYTRYDNPTVSALEELVTNLEMGDASLACSSGMAALHLALMAAIHDRPRRVLAAEAIYGATIRLLTNVMEPAGVETRWVDIFDLDAVEKAIADFKPSVLLMESVSNPLLRVGEIDRLAEIAHRHGTLLMVDSTFATPLLLRPIELGADYTVHSLTKFLSGHGDVLGGVVTTTNEHFPILKQLSKTCGANLGPFDAYLTMRGIKTFALRVERQCQNAAMIAAALRQHPAVSRVYYPDDPTHPDAAAIQRLFSPGLYGALVAFDVKGAGREDIYRVMDRLKVVVPATSLGDVHSLLLYPVMASHRDLSPKQRQRLGISDALLRMSVGIESAQDIIEDLDQALAGTLD